MSAEPPAVVGRLTDMRSLLRRTAAYTAVYAAVELAAVALLIWAFGLGWALVALAVTFVVGVLVSASQVRGQVAGLRGRSQIAAVRGGRTPQGAIADGALVGVGSFLVFLGGRVVALFWVSRMLWGQGAMPAPSLCWLR